MKKTKKKKHKKFNIFKGNGRTQCLSILKNFIYEKEKQ